MCSSYTHIRVDPNAPANFIALWTVTSKYWWIYAPLYPSTHVMAKCVIPYRIGYIINLCLHTTQTKIQSNNQTCTHRHKHKSSNIYYTHAHVHTHTCTTQTTQCIIDLPCVQLWRRCWKKSTHVMAPVDKGNIGCCQCEIYLEGQWIPWLYIKQFSVR